MAYGSEPSRQQRFKRVKQGEQPSASEWNKMCEVLERLTAGDPRHPKKPTRAIKLMRLGEAMGRFGDGWPLDAGVGDSSDAHKRLAYVQHYDETQNKFIQNSDDESKNNVTDGVNLIYDEDELVWCFYSEQSGHWHPLNPRSIRHAVTCREPTSEGFSTYPECGDNVYPIRFIRIEYEKVGGRIDLNYAYINPDDDDPDTDPDDYVLNLFDGSLDNPQPYLEEGTVIWCYNILGQWYTHICCYTCTGSSSSSSASSSSESSQSVSNSSSSTSSHSQVSSSSDSSSSGSSSSSGGSSLSASSGSSGGSSFSSSVSGYTCQNFVESVTFNAETCALTVSVKCLCWDSSLPIFVRSECE